MVRNTLNADDIERLYKYGERSELILYDIIKSYCPDVIMTERYDKFDYIIETDEKIVLIELKTRKNAKNKFNTTYFPTSKITYYKHFKKSSLDNPKNKIVYLIIVFGFPDDTDDLENTSFKYYGIQYKPSYFKDIDITKNLYCDDYNFNIPIDKLKDISYYLEFFKI
jgi:hypothetical protein